MAKQALIERELKRDRLVALSVAMKSAQLPVWVCKSCHATLTLRVSATVALSPDVPVGHSVNLASAEPRSVN
jgi:hypothetical protein